MLNFVVYMMVRVLFMIKKFVCMKIGIMVNHGSTVEPALAIT